MRSWPNIAGARGRWDAQAWTCSPFGQREADPLDLVRAARGALSGGTLIVAGSVHSRRQIHALAESGVDAFTIGSAVFDGSFSPAKGSLRGQILDILEACNSAPRIAA